MNADLRHARVRVRQALAVLEEALGPGLAEALARTAELCAQDAGYLDAAAAATLRRLLPPGDPRDALAPAPISPKEALAPDDPSGALAPALTPVVPAAALVFAGDGAGLTRSGGRLPAAAGLAAADLAALPAALRGRVLRDWLRQAGVSSLSRAHLLAVEALVLNWHGQAGVDLPGGRVRRTEGRLRFEAA
jgi:hypothetical protein